MGAVKSFQGGNHINKKVPASFAQSPLPLESFLHIQTWHTKYPSSGFNYGLDSTSALREWLARLGANQPQGCRNGDQCKLKHERMNGKCLRCGSVRPPLAQCDHPGRQKNTKRGKGKSAPTRPTSKPPVIGRTADGQAQRSPEGKGKSDQNQHKAKAKTGEVDFADGDQEEVDENADVNEEDAEACEAVADFSDSEDILAMLLTGM